MTKDGEAQAKALGRVAVGQGKLIDPSKLARIFVSPRDRARKTYELMFDGEKEHMNALYECCENIREWEYGAYEGRLPTDVRADRKARGLDTERPWRVSLDGCEEGESPEEVSARVDELVTMIKSMQEPFMYGEEPADIVVIAHGDSLRAFTKRWLGFELSTTLSMMFEPPGVGVLTYQHHNVDEPALMLGVNFGMGG